MGSLIARPAVENIPFWGAFFLLILVIGFPRIYGTEIPMALVLIPFYFAGFCRFFFSRGWFSAAFIILFSVWFVGGVLAFLNGQGGMRDIFFHFVVSVKVLLNVFFGYVICRVVLARPSALTGWLVFQSLIIIITMFSSDLYMAMLGFISPRSADVFQYIYGLRALGFGLFHVDGALTLVLALFFSMLVSNSRWINYLLLVILLPLSMAVARSAIIAYMIMGLIRRGIFFKVVLCVAFLLMIVLGFYVESGPIYEATEIFRNVFQRGQLKSESVSALSSMYALPSTFNEYLFGSGQYFSSDTSVLEFYKKTDVGYLRVLYYSGIGSLLIYILLNVYFLLVLIFDRTYVGAQNIRLFAFGLLIIFFIINFKGLQGMPIFAVALYVYSLEVKKRGRALGGVTEGTDQQG